MFQICYIRRLQIFTFIGATIFLAVTACKPRHTSSTKNAEMTAEQLTEELRRLGLELTEMNDALEPFTAGPAMMPPPPVDETAVHVESSETAFMLNDAEDMYVHLQSLKLAVARIVADKANILGLSRFPKRKMS